MPLELQTDVPGSWQPWASKYSHEGKGIPIVYVVRADGEAIYAKAGPPEGNQLPQLLQQSLQRSGAILSDRDLSRLTDAVTEAKKSLESDDVAAALRQLTSAPGSGSYAAAAVEAQGLVKAITEKADEQIAKAGELIEGGDQPFEGAMQLASASRTYAKLPNQKRAIGDLLRKFSRDEKTAPLVEQAEAVVKAQALETGRSKDSAMRSYQSILRKYPDTPAAELAIERLQTLGGSTTKVASTGSTTDKSGLPGEKPRTWTARNGKFTVVATLLSFDGKTVRLRTEGGKTLDVPAGKLSAEDGRYILQAGRK